MISRQPVKANHKTGRLEQPNSSLLASYFSAIGDRTIKAVKQLQGPYDEPREGADEPLTYREIGPANNPKKEIVFSGPRGERYYRRLQSMNEDGSSYYIQFRYSDPAALPAAQASRHLKFFSWFVHEIGRRIRKEDGALICGKDDRGRGVITVPLKQIQEDFYLGTKQQAVQFLREALPPLESISHTVLKIDKTGKVSNSYREYQTFIVADRIDRDSVLIIVNPGYPYAEMIRQFTVYTPVMYRLSKTAFLLVTYAEYIARQRLDEIRDNGGSFRLRVRAAAAYIGIEFKPEADHLPRLVQKPLLDAIEEINQTFLEEARDGDREPVLQITLEDAGDRQPGGYYNNTRKFYEEGQLVVRFFGETVRRLYRLKESNDSRRQAAKKGKPSAPREIGT